MSARKSNARESFAIQEPPRQHLPRAGNLQQLLEQRQEAAAERRSRLQDKKVQKLSHLLAQVAQISELHQQQEANSWHDAQKRFSQKIDEHMERRMDHISKRLRSLTNHNLGVQARMKEVQR